MIDEDVLKPIPCLLVMNKDGTFRLYDCRYDHPKSLVLSITIKEDKESGCAMTSLYNHLQEDWVKCLKQRLEKAQKGDDGDHIVRKPSKLEKKWKATRKKRTLFGSKKSKKRSRGDRE